MQGTSTQVFPIFMLKGMIRKPMKRHKVVRHLKSGKTVTYWRGKGVDGKRDVYSSEYFHKAENVSTHKFFQDLDKNVSGAFLDSWLMEQPIKDIPVKDIVSTQKGLTSATVKSYQNKKNNLSNAQVIKVGDKYYVHDGHHRIASQIKDGATTIKARCWDSDKVKLPED